MQQRRSWVEDLNSRVGLSLVTFVCAGALFIVQTIDDMKREFQFQDEVWSEEQRHLAEIDAATPGEFVTIVPQAGMDCWMTPSSAGEVESWNASHGNGPVSSGKESNPSGPMVITCYLGK